MFTTLPGKSTANEPYSRYVVDAVIKDLKSLDRKKCILKSDQEPAMLALQERVRQLRCGEEEQTILENSPVAESQSNGVIEKGIQEVESQARTLMCALEERLRAVIPWNSPVGAWLIEYAAVLLNLYREGKDKMVPMERLRGEKHDRPIAEFGERVHYLPLGSGSTFLDARFIEGIWMGMDLRTGEVLIGTPSGVVKARSVRRRIEEERWNAQEVLAVRGTPWEPTPGVDPDLLPTAVRRPPTEGDRAPAPPVVEPGLTARRTQLRRADFDKFGFTEGCVACRNIERW